MRPWPSVLADCGMGQPRRGDVRSTTLDRLARHGTPDDATSTGITEHVATGNAQAREAIDVVKEDGTFKNTSRPVCCSCFVAT